MRGILQLVPREADKAYVSDMLWLPKAKIPAEAIRSSLQFFLPKGSSMTLERLYDETVTHLIVPREFIPPSRYHLWPFPFIDLSPTVFPQSHLWHRITLKDETQERAWTAFALAPGGILNLAPGKGKTVLALKRLVELGVPGLIVVHNTYLFEQWKKEIEKFVVFPPQQSYGVIQGPEFDCQSPLVVAMLSTLALRAREGDIPAEFFRHFGAVVYDEVHHLAANLFCLAAPLIRGYRFGLTATPRRTDGLEFVYNYHLGGVFYSDMTPDLVPVIYFQQTPVEIDLKIKEVHDTTGQVNISKLRGYLGRDPASNWFRGCCMREAYNAGRKILAVSHCKDQLIQFSEQFSDSGLIVQETPQKERPSIVRRSRITFAIASLGVEGLDDPSMDVLMFLTPFSNEKDLIQSLGRVQRAHQGKKQPVVIIFEDVQVGPMRGLCNKLKRILNSQQQVFQTLAPPLFT